jgi:hypothetical protein
VLPRCRSRLAESRERASRGRQPTERLAAGRTKATINRELAVIRRGYKLATKGKDKVEMYPESNAREGFVEYSDFLELVRHLPAPIDDVAWFAYLMGWRREQALSLNFIAIPPKTTIYPPNGARAVA